MTHPLWLLAALAFPLCAQDVLVPAADAPGQAEAASTLPPPSLGTQSEPKTEAKPEPKVEAKPQEPAPEPQEEPKPEPKAKPAHKAEPKAQAKNEAKKASAARADAGTELRFLQEAAASQDAETRQALIADLQAFIDARPDSRQAPEALSELAALQQKAGDASALVTTLRLLYEYPESKGGLQLKSAFLEQAAQKLPRKLKAAASELVRVPESADKADRLAALLERLSGDVGEALHEPALAEARRFHARYPDYAGSDRVALASARLRERGGDWAAALLGYRRLLAIFPESALRAKAQAEVGALYADRLKDPKKAIEAFQELAELYPDSPEVLPSLERTAALLSEKLKQPELAVEVDEKIVKLFPDTDSARRALADAAKLLREKLQRPADAAQTLKRLSEGFSSHPDAAGALYESAQIYEDDLKDAEKAIAAYRDVDAKFPASKLARKARDRVAKLDKK